MAFFLDDFYTSNDITHKKGDLGFCEKLFVTLSPCCDVSLSALFGPYIYKAKPPIATYIHYTEKHNFSKEDCANISTSFSPSSYQGREVRAWYKQIVGNLLKLTSLA